MRAHVGVRAATLAVMAIALLAAPVAGANARTTYKETGIRAFASNESCTDETAGPVTCSGETLDVFDGTIRSTETPTVKGQQVCYSDFTTTYDPVTGESSGHGVFGCAFGGSTVASRDLGSLTLAPTVIDLVAVECNSVACTETPGGSTTVSGRWTGVGTIVAEKGKNKVDDGACLQISGDKIRSRQASFEGSIDADWAMIGEGTFTFRAHCSA